MCFVVALVKRRCGGGGSGGDDDDHDHNNDVKGAPRQRQTTTKRRNKKLRRRNRCRGIDEEASRERWRKVNLLLRMTATPAGNSVVATSTEGDKLYANKQPKDFVVTQVVSG